MANPMAKEFVLLNISGLVDKPEDELEYLEEEPQRHKF